jgi:SAM-dependent methyltransferase
VTVTVADGAQVTWCYVTDPEGNVIELQSWRSADAGNTGIKSIDFTPTIKRFSGFADLYDRYRPASPPALSDVLCLLAGVERPALVVDLGCGTGLSTRAWSGSAAQVIGVDASADMLRRAEAATAEPNVTYRAGLSHATGLAAGCADIVTCCQAFHWMEPESTLAEVARVLRPGGVFAACDHDFWPILSPWEAEAALGEWGRRIKSLEERERVSGDVPRWEKSGHLARIQASGRFHYTREILLHHVEMGNAERLVGLALSQGAVQSLFKAGLSEAELGLAQLRADAARLLGDAPQPWYWCMRVRAGVL